MTSKIDSHQAIQIIFVNNINSVIVSFMMMVDVLKWNSNALQRKLTALKSPHIVPHVVKHILADRHVTVNWPTRAPRLRLLTLAFPIQLNDNLTVLTSSFRIFADNQPQRWLRRGIQDVIKLSIILKTAKYRAGKVSVTDQEAKFNFAFLCVNELWQLAFPGARDKTAIQDHMVQLA